MKCVHNFMVLKIIELRDVLLNVIQKNRQNHKERQKLNYCWFNFQRKVGDERTQIFLKVWQAVAEEAT